MLIILVFLIVFLDTVVKPWYDTVLIIYLKKIIND
ncbi:MAG: palindromic element RPE4 domain-containing protein [Rickettsia endosymbiont of Ixodes ricinus]|nr:palindromic element RPE4 domain-containing protein [Rickettsia endosymbiont of Ixodes ricinus]